MTRFSIVFALISVLFQGAFSIPMETRTRALADDLKSLKRIDEELNVDNEIVPREQRDASPYDSSELINFLGLLTNAFEDSMNNLVPKRPLRVRRQSSRSNSKSTVTTVTKQSRRRQEQDYWLHERLWREFYGYLAEFMSRNFFGSDMD